MLDSKRGVIIQARMGSTRLHGKMAREFYNGMSLLEIVLTRLRTISENHNVIVATTVSERDAYIVKTAEKYDIGVYRGSENNVLSRFIGAAEMFGITQIIRVCADNPFIQLKYIEKLLAYHTNTSIGYVGYLLNNSLPGIKSHLGFFPEMVSLDALKQIDSLDLDPAYREHVTSYYYGPYNDTIPVAWINLHFESEIMESMRLTIDTEDDFQIADDIYKYLITNGKDFNEDEIIEFLSSNPVFLRKMEAVRKKNEK
jgi:spore coat polysaccharide biosynthesis protein SpsF (cytidylyltransferase family)